MLNDLIIPSKANQSWRYSGMDHFLKCRSKWHFLKYPHSISYHYNSRGFRDEEWPTNLASLKDSIWCIGESFTAGIGSPVDYTWPYLLKEKTKTNTINVSLDGASNDWIARRACQIIHEVSPRVLIIHWTYINRRESSDIKLSDEKRRLHYDWGVLSKNDCIENFISNLRKVNACANNCKVIHSMVYNNGVPDMRELQQLWNQLKGNSWPQTIPYSWNQIPEFVINELGELLGQLDHFKQAFNCAAEINDNRMILVNQIDFARDGLHYGIKTTESLVNSIMEQLDTAINGNT